MPSPIKSTSLYNLHRRSGRTDRTVKLWSLNGKLLYSLEGHSAAVGAVTFSTDGKLLATASDDKTVRLWTHSGKLVTTLKGHMGQVNALRFTLDQKVLVTAGADKTIILWNIESFELKDILLHSCEWIHNYLRNNLYVPKDVCGREFYSN